jgi:tryptophan synthase alpha chain
MPIAFKRKPGLVAYITCGDPTLEVSRDVAFAAIAAGAEVVELGVPFSDPVADGPVIQRASERALHQGTNIDSVLQVAREIREQSNAGIILFSYMNPILQFGIDRFCASVAAAGADGALVTDLPIEEAGDYLRAIKGRRLASVFLAAPTSTDERLRSIARQSRGFIYAISRTGITGTRNEVSNDARSLVARIRTFTHLPIAVGFGISNAEQFAEIGEFADAAVVGSAIVQRVEENPGREAESVSEFLSSFTGVGRQAGVPL